MRRASASPAAWARASRAMRSSVALVATTASVVLRPFPTAPNGAPPRAKCVSASANVPSAARAPARTAPEPSRMLPTAFRTTSAPTTMSPPLAAQLPTPPFMAARGPSAFPTVAPAPLEPAHHAIRGAESEGGAAGEQNGVDAVDHMAGVQRVELAGSGGTATDRAGGAHPTFRSEYHAATRGPLEVGPMPYRNTSDGGETGGSGGRHGGAKHSSAGSGCGGHIR